MFSPCTRKRKPLRDLGLLLSLVNETRKVRVYGVMFPLYASYRNDTSKYVKAILRQGGAIWGHENTFPGKTSLSKEALEGHPGFTSPFGFKLEGTESLTIHMVRVNQDLTGLTFHSGPDNTFQTLIVCPYFFPSKKEKANSSHSYIN